MKKKTAYACAAAGLAAGFAGFCLAENNWLEVTTYTVKTRFCLEKPVKLIHLSDLHGKQYGQENERLCKRILARCPDVVLITGDMIDDGGKEINSVSAFLNRLSRRVPVYYISGNHEYGRGLLGRFSNRLEKAGVKVLRNWMEKTVWNGLPVYILGLNELEYQEDGEGKKLLHCLEQQEGLRILLSHYPETFAMRGKKSYGRYDIDLMFAGHAHGGQFILPMVGSVYAPGQGIFPEYCFGVHPVPEKLFAPEESPCHGQLIVSRGLGGVEWPPRIFNRPEIVEVILT